MISLDQLWLPILLSAVFVFFASSILNMLLKFWHMPDYHGFSNEDEVRAAINKANPSAGMYSLPMCTPDKMKNPEMLEKLKTGPVGMVVLRQPGAMNFATTLGQWFVFCLLIAIVCAVLGAQVLAAGAARAQVFHVIGIAALLGFAFGSLPSAIWWCHPWRVAFKHVIDGVIYAAITATTFAWLWP